MHNVNSMMYYGATPWHGLGKKVENATTSAEAIEAAGLNWKVEKVQLQRIDGPKVDKFATIRSDTRETLGVVGNVYDPLENKSAFSFFDAMVGEKAAMYHTAGCLGTGEIVWILAKLPGYIRVIGDDVSEKFILLTNRHDGRGAVQVQFTPIRVVCQNTLNIALGQTSKKFKARHDGLLGTHIKDVREYLGLIDAKTALFEEAARKMAAIQLNHEGWKEFVIATGLVPEADKDGKTSTRAENIMEDVSRLFEHGKGQDMPGAKKTAWGGFNAVVEYVDYVRSSKNGQRAQSLLLGSGADVKQKAWDKALSLI